MCVLHAGRGYGALDGATFAVKDNLCVKGMTTTCASKFLQGWLPLADLHLYINTHTHTHTHTHTTHTPHTLTHTHTHNTHTHTHTHTFVKDSAFLNNISKVWYSASLDVPLSVQQHNEHGHRLGG